MQENEASVPSDLYDYLEKMDRDEEEAEEEVESSLVTYTFLVPNSFIRPRHGPLRSIKNI